MKPTHEIVEVGTGRVLGRFALAAEGVLGRLKQKLAPGGLRVRHLREREAAKPKTARERKPAEVDPS